MPATTIAQQVIAMDESMASQPPNEAMGAFARERAGLADVAAPTTAAAPGSKLPDAHLLDVHGAETTLYGALGDQTAVLVFYRGGWCPFCNIALNTYAAELVPELARRGVALVAVSPQTPDASLTLYEKNELTFTVLSDPGNRLAAVVGIVTEPSDEARAAQLALGLDLTEVNADGTIALPMPTTIVVDANRVVRWIDIHPDYSTRSETNEILAAVDSVGR